MRILHCFDKYLNSTMNWAYNAIARTPGTQPMIAAPLIVKNQFYDSRFSYIFSQWQWEHPQDEWSFSAEQRGASWFFRRDYWKKAFGSLKKHPPALVHAHFAPVGCSVMRFAEKKGLPLVTSFYGADYEKPLFNRPQYRAKYRQLFELSALLLCEGDHGASILARMGCPESKIRVVPLGIEVEKILYRFREKPPGQIMLLQAATIIEKKGYMTTLEAFRLASRTCHGIHLTIVGEPIDKNLVKAMRRYIAEHQLENQIAWLDFVDTRQFHQFLAGFDVLVHPSCYAENRDCEGGAPIVLLDAQAIGLPVIATAHCDIPAEVLHERTGLLAPERDPAALAAHIERFYRMENTEYQKFSRSARRHVEQNFDVKGTGQKLRALYESLTPHSSPLTP